MTSGSAFDLVVGARARRYAAGLATAIALTCAVAPAAAQGVAIIRDTEIEETVRAYSDPLIRAAELKPEDVRITLVQDRTVNAFVTGGQRMFLHTGFLMAAKSPNQVKGVLAHEIGHISGGHLARSAEAMQRSLGPALISIGLGLIAIAAGAPDAGAALISGSQQFALANFIRHTQVQESAADQAAVTFLDRSGRSARGLLEFFENYRAQEVLSEPRRMSYFRTHPLSSDRIEALRARVQAAPNRDAPDTPEDLERFRRMQAKLIGYLEPTVVTLRRYPETDTSIPARYARAIAYMRVPDFGAAYREAQALVADEPANPYFRELLGELLMDHGRVADSLPHHRRALELKPDSTLLQINLGRALVATERADEVAEAIRLLTDAAAKEPNNPALHSVLARAYGLTGETALAQLATAESAFARGDFIQAQMFARRARDGLAEGEASWRRASDIALAAEAQMRDAERRG